MVVVLTMKQVYLCHQCAESDLLYQTYLPKPCFFINQYNGQFGCGICKHPGRYDQQTRGRLYEYRPSGTVAVRTAQETRMFARVEEARGTTVFGIEGENVFVNWLTF